MQFLFRVLFIAVLSLAAGCANVQRNGADGIPLMPDQGLLALHLSSNADWIQLGYLKYVAHSGSGTILSEELLGSDGSFTRREKDLYFLVPVREGDYMFSRVSLIKRRGKANLYSTNRFTIKRNEITYVGHINLRSILNGKRFCDAGESRCTVGDVSIVTSDQEADMRRYIADEFPVYSRRFGFSKSIAQIKLQ